MKTFFKVYGADKNPPQTHTQPSPENFSKGPARFFKKTLLNCKFSLRILNPPKFALRAAVEIY